VKRPQPVEKALDQCSGAGADQFVRPEAMDFVPRQAKVTVEGDHFRVSRQGRRPVSTKVLRSIDLDDDALPIWQQQQEIHPLPRQPRATVEEPHYGWIIVKIDLGDNGWEL
jgi:hypothetical protein